MNAQPGGVLEVLVVATRLGLTSFGGPIAHLGYFHAEYVVRRKWLDEQTYADVVALCQFLPGPASSQVGMAIGILRAGLPGALAAWLGFTLPSALLLVAVAYGVAWAPAGPAESVFHGLKLVAVAVVAQAVWSMAGAMCPDARRATFALAAAIVALLWPGAPGQLLTLAVAGGAGLLVLRPSFVPAQPVLPLSYGRGVAVAALVLFGALLAGLPIAAQVTGNPLLAATDAFYRTGSLVFGGGHVVLPLLQAEVVPPGWVTADQFLAGYGAAQAVPGPLFTLAAFLGAVMTPAPDPLTGATLALGAIFLPSLFLVVGTLPFWGAIRSRLAFRAALQGVNAAVVGLLAAALYTPVFTSAVRGPHDLAVVLAASGLLMVWKAPPVLVVAVTVALTLGAGVFGLLPGVRG